MPPFNRPGVPDETIKARLREIYATAEPTGFRPTRAVLVGSLAVGWERLRALRDAMVEAGELPDMRPNTGGAPGKRSGKLAMVRSAPAAPASAIEPDPIAAVPVLKRDPSAAVKRAPARAKRARLEWRDRDGEAQFAGEVRAVRRAERGLGEYREMLARRIAERERKAAMA